MLIQAVVFSSAAVQAETEIGDSEVKPAKQTPTHTPEGRNIGIFVCYTSIAALCEE